MDEYESLLPTQNHNVQPPETGLHSWPSFNFQASLVYHIRATRHTMCGAYGRVKQNDAVSAFYQLLKAVGRHQPQAIPCISISCALIGVNLLCTRLEPLVPRTTLLGAYLLATTTLEWLGKLAWTKFSCAFDSSIQLGAARQSHISAEDKTALSKSESFDSWGHTFFFKFMPTITSVILVSAGTLLVPLLALATVVLLRKATTHLGFSTYVYVLEKKDIRNQKYKSVDRVGQVEAQSEFTAARTSRITGCLLRQGFLATVIFGICITPASTSGGIVAGMVLKDVISLDKHLEKLSKNWDASRRMLELSREHFGMTIG